MIKLYGHEMSGNSYKVQLLLSLLGLDGETKLADAQAILVYLARQYGGEAWLPLDALSLAQVIRWLSTTAGEVRQGLENARLYHLFKVTNINIERATQKSEYILTQLDKHLSDRTWLEFERPTIADIAVFPYVALARDGKIDLSLYPNVLAWIDRVKQLPHYIPMAGI
jgi:glutathione S-transferase